MRCLLQCCLCVPHPRSAALTGRPSASPCMLQVPLSWHLGPFLALVKHSLGQFTFLTVYKNIQGPTGQRQTDCLSAGSFPRPSQAAVSIDLHPGLPHRRQGPGIRTSFYRPSRRVSRKLDKKQSTWDQHSAIRGPSCKQWLSCSYHKTNPCLGFEYCFWLQLDIKYTFVTVYFYLLITLMRSYAIIMDT